MIFVKEYIEAFRLGNNPFQIITRFIRGEKCFLLLLLIRKKYVGCLVRSSEDGEIENANNNRNEFFVKFTSLLFLSFLPGVKF